MEKNVLCFGDSNTWGALPGGDGVRVPLRRRWTTVLHNALNGGAGSAEENGYHVIPEGLNGRTTAFVDPLAPDRSGAAALPMVLKTHFPLDLVLIMLGTNDTKNYFQVSAAQIGLALERLVEIVLTSDAGPFPGPGGQATAPRLLIVAPTPLTAFDESMLPHFAPPDRAIGISRELAPVFRSVAEAAGVAFFDAGPVVTAGSDGVHLDVDGHRRLGEALVEPVRLVLGDR